MVINKETLIEIQHNLQPLQQVQPPRADNVCGARVRVDRGAGGDGVQLAEGGVDVRLDAEAAAQADRGAQHRVAPRHRPHVQADALRRREHALLAKEHAQELRHTQEEADVSVNCGLYSH